MEKTYTVSAIADLLNKAVEAKLEAYFTVSSVVSQDADGELVATPSVTFLRVTDFGEFDLYDKTLEEVEEIVDAILVLNKHGL